MSNVKLQMTRLGDLTTLISSGSTPRGGETVYLKDGPVMLVRSQNVRMNSLDLSDVAYISDEIDAEMKRSVVHQDDVLLNITGASIGRVARFSTSKPHRANVNQHVCVIRTVPNKLDSRFLTYYLSSPEVQHDINNRHQHGGTRQALTFSQIADFPIPFLPLLEQQRIADILDKADAIRRTRQSAVEDVTTLSFSVFHQMFGEPRRNPYKWPSSPLSALVREDDKINYGVVQPGQDYPGGVPIVRVGDFARMKIDKANIKRIDPEIEANYKRSRLVGDEALLACVGSIGLVALADESLRGFNTVRAVARIRCGPKLNRHYLAYYISTPFLQSFFLQSTRTVSQPTLNIGLIEETNVLVPPIALQNRFAAVLAMHQETAHRFDESANGTEQLFNSLVQRAFRGEL